MKKIVSILLKYGIPVAVSVGLAYFLYTNVDIDAITTSLRQDVNYRWFLPVIVVSVMSHVFRGLRWRIQLRAVNVNAPLSAVVNSIFGTYFVNLLFPRLGEVWRCGYIANREKAPFSLVLGSMVGRCCSLQLGNLRGCGVADGSAGCVGDSHRFAEPCSG